MACGCFAVAEAIHKMASDVPPTARALTCSRCDSATCSSRSFGSTYTVNANICIYDNVHPAFCPISITAPPPSHAPPRPDPQLQKEPKRLSTRERSENPFCPPPLPPAPPYLPPPVPQPRHKRAPTSAACGELKCTRPRPASAPAGRWRGRSRGVQGRSRNAGGKWWWRRWG